MKKIPSLFVRDWAGDPSRVTGAISLSCRWVFGDPGFTIATRKRDGTCVMVDSKGNRYRRFTLKPGRKLPMDFQYAGHDQVTSKIQGWVPIHKDDDPNYSILLGKFGSMPAGTYELCGPNYQGNPEKLDEPTLFRHGGEVIKESFASRMDVIDYLSCASIEGIVWHHVNGTMAKIKSRDFGIQWPR